MRWTERQRAMLREMGIVFSWREAPAVAGMASGDDAGEVTEALDPGPASGAPERAGAPAAAPARSSPAAPLSTGPVAALVDAEWLVVADPFLAADASAADQERLLDNMLAAIGVSRSAPARAGRAALAALPVPAGAPGASVASAAWLDAAQAVVRPACILALGRGAAQAVLDTDEPLGALRGRREARAGVPVIVTFAPAFLLRHPAEKAKAWSDLCLAVRSVEEAT